MKRMPTFRELRRLTDHQPGAQRWVFVGDEPFHACLDCSRQFPQTTEGWAAMRQHRLEHGRSGPFEWSELDGKTLRIVVVDVPADKPNAIGGDGSRTIDLYGVDDETGAVYHLGTPVDEWTPDYRRGGTKWKHTKLQRLLNGPSDTPSEAASPSNNYALGDGK